MNRTRSRCVCIRVMGHCSGGYAQKGSGRGGVSLGDCACRVSLCCHSPQLIRAALSDDAHRVQEMSCGGYATGVDAVRFDNSGTRVASVADDACVVWNLCGKDASSVPTVLVGHMAKVTDMAWSPPQQGSSTVDDPMYAVLATVSADGHALVYDPGTAEPGEDGNPNSCIPLAQTPACDNGVTALAWMPDGRSFVTVDVAGAVRRWDMGLFGAERDDERGGQGEEEEEEEEEEVLAVPLPQM